MDAHRSLAAISPEYRRSWRREVSGVNDCMNNVEQLEGSPFGKVTASALFCGGDGRRPELHRTLAGGVRHGECAPARQTEGMTCEEDGKHKYTKIGVGIWSISPRRRRKRPRTAAEPLNFGEQLLAEEGVSERGFGWG